MSTLLEQASLIMIPSGYKEDVVYSVIPENGNGDLAFTRASNGTRVNSAGLVEVVAWNLVQNSENFSAVWTAQNSTITSNSIVAPNGTTTADSLIASNAVNAASGVYVAENTSVVKTMSCYVKKGSKRWAAFIGYNGNSNCWFDLDNAVVGTRGAYYSASSITSVGNGWYRIDAVMTTAIGADVNIGIYAADNDNSLTCTGDGTTVSSYIWGFQLNIGSTAKPYFPTTDRLNVPRLTYQNGGGGCPSLLLEKQSTNLVTYSEDFTQWANAGGTITANTTTSPDGTQNADTLTGARYQTALGTNIFTFSCYAKKLDSDNKFVLRLDIPATNIAQFDLGTGTIDSVSSGFSATINFVGNGWYRCTFTSDSSVAISNAVVISANAGSNSTYVWGAQVEVSSYPTSYIPTTSSSATRVADACSKTGISSLIGQTEGVMFCDFNWEQKEGVFFINSISDGTTNNDIFMAFGSSANNRIRFSIASGGVNYVNEDSAVLSSGRYKIAFAYASNDAVVYINGTQLFTDSSVTVPATSAFKFLRANDTLGFNGTINQQLLFKTRLTNAELASLTTI